MPTTSGSQTVLSARQNSMLTRGVAFTTIAAHSLSMWQAWHTALGKCIPLSAEPAHIYLNLREEWVMLVKGDS